MNRRYYIIEEREGERERVGWDILVGDTMMRGRVKYSNCIYLG